MNAQTQSTGMQHNLVTFRAGKQIYALPIEPIVQIIGMVTITPIPQANPAILGVINVHGELIPAVDLHRHLGLPALPLRLYTPIILLQYQQHTIGLVVEEVLDVLTVSDEQIITPQAILPEQLGSATFLRGLVKTNDQASRAVFILDLETLFRRQTAQLAQEIASQPPSPPGVLNVNDVAPADSSPPVTENLPAQAHKSKSRATKKTAAPQTQPASPVVVGELEDAG